MALFNMYFLRILVLQSILFASLYLLKSFKFLEIPLYFSIVLVLPFQLTLQSVVD